MAEERGDARAEQATGGLRREEQAEAEVADAETVVREEGQYGLHGEEGDVPDRRTEREPEQQLIPHDVRGPGPRLPEQRLAGASGRPGHGGQRPYEQCGERERHPVGEQRNRPPEREQRTARGRPREAGGGGLGAAQTGVGALKECGLAAEQIRQIGRGGRVEEESAEAEQEGDGREQRNAQHVEHGRRRGYREQHRTRRVRDPHRAAAVPAVHQRTAEYP